MCGRYTLTSAPDVMRTLFGYGEQPNFPARYNIAPTQPIAIVRLVDGQRQFALMRWGLLPSWVKDPKTFSLIINARGEGVLEKPAFRAAMRRRRCLIPADGFYEWKAGAPRKQPYFIRARSGDPIAFAGLWETWTGPNGEELDTAAVVTTTATPALSALSDRMPVIIPPEAFGLWLGDGHVEGAADLNTATTLIRPAPDDLLESYPVSTDVNHVANDNPKLLDLFTGSLDAGSAIGHKIARAKAAKPEKADQTGGRGVLF